MSVVLLLTWGTYLETRAQKVDEFIGSYSGPSATGYLQPLSDVLTSTFNSGLIHKTSIDSGFHVYLGATGYGIFILSDQLKYFTGTTERYFSPQQTARVSTILGPAETVTVQGDKATSYTFPAGLGLLGYTLAAPQITIGTIFGTEFMGRFAAFDLGEDFGKVKLLGGGLRHDLTRYFMPNSRYKVSVEYFYQQLEAGRYAELTTHKGGLYAGQQGKIANYYVYAGYQKGTLAIHYNDSADATPIDIRLTNKNPLLLGIGGGLKLWIFRLDAQASFIRPVVVAASVGINF